MKGMPVSQAPAGGEWLPKIGNNLTAVGNAQGNAYVIPAGQDLSIFTSVAGGTGALLPSSGVSLGEEYGTANHGGNALLVYPGSGGKIGTQGTNAGFSVAAGKAVYFTYVGLQNWTANG